MSSATNTRSGQEYSPYVSADGLFFFMSTRPADLDRKYAPPLTYGRMWDTFTGPHNGLPDIWWVDADFIMGLKPPD